MGNLHHIIRQLRNAAGLKQSDMAEAIGTSVPAYSQIESGKQRLTLEKIESISSALKMRPSQLLELAEPEDTRSGAVIAQLQNEIDILKSTIADAIRGTKS